MQAPTTHNSMSGAPPRVYDGYAPAPQQGHYSAAGHPSYQPQPAANDWKEPLLLAPFRDIPLCLCSCFCPFVRMGLTVERARLGMTFVTAVILLCLLHLTNYFFSGLAAEERRYFGYSSGAAFLFEFISLAALVVMIILMMSWRERLRRQYAIDGNACFDCLAVTFCSCCAVAQESYEADMRELGFLSSCTCSVFPEPEREPLHREVV